MDKCQIHKLQIRLRILGTKCRVACCSVLAQSKMDCY